jgi:transcriptional regulator with XRE-family HTH domain
VPSPKRLKAVRAQLAKALRTRREALGLSLSAVAERAGLSYQMVSYVEREMRMPTVETLLRLAEALDADPADLLRKACEAATRG